MCVLLAVLREPKLCSVGGSSSINRKRCSSGTHVSDSGTLSLFFSRRAMQMPVDVDWWLQ